MSQQDLNIQEKQNKKLGKVEIWVISLVIVLLLIIGGTIAFLATKVMFTVTFNIPGGQDASVNIHDPYKGPNVTALLTGDIILKNGIPMKVTVTGDVDPSREGTYTETYHADLLHLFPAEVSRTVRVADIQAPDIELKGELEITMDQTDVPFEDPGFTATDNVDGDLTNSVRVSGMVDTTKGGEYKLTYKATDAAGNTAFVDRIIRIRDIHAPEMTLVGDEVMVILRGSVFEDPGCIAVDDTDGELEVSVEGVVDHDQADEYNLVYTAEDAAGNQSQLQRLVIVQERDADKIVDPGRKVIYLTFDDGPGPYTQELLDVLEKYQVKATFFVTDQFPNYEYMIGKEAKAGHTVAVHSYNHNFDEIYVSQDAFFADFTRMRDIVEAQTGKKPKILRFPGGTSNTVSRRYCEGIMTELIEACNVRGIRFFDWNVDSDDAGAASTTEEVVENVISGVRGNEASFVLQHDIKHFSVQAVEQIIQWGLENGYRFLPLTTTSPRCEHKANN